MRITANWEQAMGAVQQLQVAIRSDTQQVIAETVALGERVAKQAAPKDTSNLARSIFSDAQPLMGVVQVPGGAGSAQIGQAATQEFGRGANKKMPPPESLRGWAGRHGFDLSKNGGKGVLFVLARSIGRKGYAGTGYMQAALDAMRNALPRFVEEAARRIEQRGERP